MKFKVLKQADEITFKENSLAWHFVIDLTYLKIGSIISTEELAEMMNTEEAYYFEAAKELENAGYIEILKGENK